MKQDRHFSRSRRSTSPQLKNKKALKNKQKKNHNLQSSSSKTKSISQEIQPGLPEERNILNLIQELETQDQKGIENQKLIHLCLQDTQNPIINENQELSEIQRQSQYNQNYHQECQQSMRNEYVFLGNSLSKHMISERQRVKMVNWMVEVLSNYNETTSDITFFRSVSIMDHYLQKSIFKFSDSNLHLIGITSMFIATKLEDIYHIPLKDFVTRVSHNQYSFFAIKAMEQSILETLNFEVTFPTSLDFLQNIFYQCFSLNDNPNLQDILDSSIYILKMCLYDYTMTSFNLYTLAASSLIFSIKDFVNKNYLNDRNIVIDQFVIIYTINLVQQNYVNLLNRLNRAQFM
ncbi:unnamed protein product (macronuclear) [Paramecium tetraurelia]|uniref:Cyclin-like domain-containing protein n=1 Tax=Paramecium tetraurelia TaxID=5888 RepID=A0BHA8_PARTE|nr:uncharacterized protein GSPATT00028960001 [Paramecium tetraurelia]CAK57925.1 unnamed protein product [Paramecium tetraurelia]|eukprot:XP_001425323.1 hypothetical protein (macronuclear) [Paramecium tetraurelia strain d4-2]